MVFGAEVVVADIFQGGRLRGAGKAQSACRYNERLTTSAIGFDGGMNDRFMRITLDHSNGCRIADERVNIAIFRRSLAAEDVRIDQDNFADGRLFQKGKGLD